MENTKFNNGDLPRNCRLCIYPKDVQRIMGKEYNQARLYLHKVRKHFNKEAQQLVTIQEFCQYSGLHFEQVIKIIQS